MGGRAAEGPWLSLSNISSSSANKTTDGETTELRSHTEQFRSTNWSLKDPGADSSPPPPQSDKETPADTLWPESPKTKDPQSTDLKQKNMDYNLEQTRSNTRLILIWNQVYPHQTPSPIAVDSKFGLIRQQEDNAGVPQRAVLVF